MSTSSCRAAAWQRTARAGSPAGRASSYQCASCPGCSAGCFLIGWPRRTAPAGSPLVTLPRLPTPSTPRPTSRRSEWVVYAKRPFAGPEAVLAYLSRYTHRVAIGNSRLVALDKRDVTFRWKDYRARGKGVPWQKTMTLAVDEFIRRFLLHVLPDGFHRIRHYGLFASGTRVANIARIRRLLAPAFPSDDPAPAATACSEAACSCCGGRLVIIERFLRGEAPQARSIVIRIDTS